MAPWLENFLVFAVGAGLFFLLRLLSASDRWARALTYLKKDRLGQAAGIVIVSYLLIGTLDLVKLSSSKSALDWILRDLLGFVDEPTKASYSEPFARTTFALSNGAPLSHPGHHLLGTTQLGKDTFVQALKGSSTALLLGLLTSAIYIPIGTVLGLVAGYYRRWVDDAVQYLYGTINAIPDILLLIAMLMVLGKGIGTMSLALSVTSWVSLCRLLRGETLRLGERQFVSAARAVGQTNWKILFRHLLPNVMHLVVINFVLGFSSIVLAEAILSYLGVGTPIGTASWGQMIDGARGELSREPVVWWNVTAAAAGLFGLVLSLNIFADSLRRAFDPRRG